MDANNIKADTSKSTILIITMGFLILYLAFSWQWAVIVSLLIGILGAISTVLSQKIEWAWMKLAKFMGYIIPNILLTVVFFLILFPLSLVSRLFTKDPLMLSGHYKTYFIDKKSNTEKNSFERIW